MNKEQMERDFETRAIAARVGYRSEQMGVLFYDPGTKPAAWWGYQAGYEAGRATEAATPAPTAKDCGACGDGCPGKACRVESESPAPAAAAPTIRSIAENVEFKNTAMALHYNWTPELVHKLIGIVDDSRRSARKEGEESLRKAFDALMALSGETIEARNAEIADLRARLASAGAGSELHGFHVEDLEAIAEELSGSGYDQHVNTGNVTGLGDCLLPTAPAAAAKFIRAALLARTTNEGKQNG